MVRDRTLARAGCTILVVQDHTGAVSGSPIVNPSLRASFRQNPTQEDFAE